MATSTYHMCVDIAGILRWPDRTVSKLCGGDGSNGRHYRELLKLELARGRRVLPMGEPCEGFDYDTGCPGHPHEPSPQSSLTTTQKDGGLSK